MSDVTLTVDAPFGAPRAAAPLWGVRVAWCLDEPERVGQMFLLRGVEGEIGRGPGDGEHPRLNPCWVRGSQVQLLSPLTTRRVSRRQLVLRAGPRLTIENVGKTAMWVAGRAVERAQLAEHQVFELENSLVFVVVRCALAGSSEPGFPPGVPDASGILGESDAIWALRTRLAEVRGVPGHVLITGPSGAGKELAATALRDGVQRWVARSAATIPDSLAAAELFGNRRDYPNAGMPDRPGLIGEADGGVLYLDEIGELPTPVQSSLLRVLDAGEYQRLGETRTRHAQIRVVGATNQPIDSLRHDLVARFRHRITVPGLGERVDDIPLLMQHLLERAREQGAPARFFTPQARVTPRLVRWLLERTWTTHIRELDRLLWHALQSSPEDYLDVPVATADPEPAFVWSAWVGAPPDSIPAEVLQACLDEHNGSQEATWRGLQLSSRHVLRRLIQRHDLVVRRRSEA